MPSKDFMKLLQSLYNYGLGNYYVLHRTQTHVYFGNLIFEKGKLSVQDSGMLAGLSPELFKPVWEESTIGMVSHSSSFEWESLTFYGIEECEVKPDLTTTRSSALAAAENEYGDNLVNFVGTVYRGFELMLDHSFLPVILLSPIKSSRGEPGLAVSDLRLAPMQIDLLIKLHDMVVKSIDKYRVLNVDDVKMTGDEFEKYFSDYIP